jgi:hypothetical protein
MISTFLMHHFSRARRGEITNGIRHCHVRGLTSIMLHEEPGNRVRLFYANADHEMSWSGMPQDPMPLAIHPHRTDIKLVGVFGQAQSIAYTTARTHGAENYRKCKFVSAIASGEQGQLVDTGEDVPLIELRRVSLGFFGSESLYAEELHTVVVAPRGEAAWLVFEGASSRDYSPECYTNQPRWSAQGLYQKATQDEIEQALIICHSRLP